MLYHQKEPDGVREMHEHRVLQQTQQSAPNKDQPTRRCSEREPAGSHRVKYERQSLLTKKFAPIDIGGYFAAASNSFTFAITLKAAA